MKKIVLTCGLISGLIVSLVLVIASWTAKGQMDFKYGMLYGFGSMLLAFSLIFVGIKNYRDRANGGQVSFGKAFLIGFYIALIASTMYVATWVVYSSIYMPDFADLYAKHSIESMQQHGASQVDIDKATAEMKEFAIKYRNPVYKSMMTYVEILPLGIVVSLIAALILKRRAKPVAAM